MLLTTLLPETGTVLTYVIVSVTSFSLGSMIGWSAAQNLDNIEKSTVRRMMSVVMLTAYVISLMADIWVSTYQTPFLLHTIMGGIFGYLFSREDGVNINFANEK